MTVYSEFVISRHVFRSNFGRNVNFLRNQVMYSYIFMIKASIEMKVIFVLINTLV